ncbi:MAG: 1-phosphofructokinase family hexose kinase [Gemmatimonadales bacterium]|nr:MAG: 1-phosphofructokinase family hexose kinase [Gemmatimonadales bacterium]
MKHIVTLTVNPTIDKNTRVKRVRAGEKLRCESPRREPGGGGINVSRAVHRLGGRSLARYLAGGATGTILESLLDREGVEHEPIPIEGWTRENLVVSEEGSDDQYRFGMPGPEVSVEEWKKVLDGLERLDPVPAYLVASGSLAPGMPGDFYARVARIVRELGARLVVDTSGAPLREAVEAGAFLIKPNIAEFQELAGEELPDERAQREAGREMIGRGSVHAIALSLGRGGALLITEEGSEPIRTPTVPIRSKVGAGDSMVAGTVLALARGEELRAAVRFGVAAGAAAVMTEGTELCRREDAERLHTGMEEEG